MNRQTDGRRKDDARLQLIVKAIRMCRILAFEELTMDELADRLGCTGRTVRRFIYALRAAGVDVMQFRRSSMQLRELDEDVYAGMTTNRHADTYRLDRRAWNGAIYLPKD